MSKQVPVDAIAADNRERWNRLVEAGVMYGAPWLDLTPDIALERIDPHGVIGRIQGEIAGKHVLCLAAGGGQQSAAFALLGANVTVCDLSDRQLEQDHVAAAHYGRQVQTLHADMRDLSALADGSFNIVYQAYSINFVPSIKPVLAEAARLLRPGGLYHLQWANPFIQMIDPETDWTGAGYLLRHPYQDGVDLSTLYPTWTVEQADGSIVEVTSPHEFVHTLSTMINTLAAHGFAIVHAAEVTVSDPDPTPGSWDHYVRVAPPYLTLWSTLGTR